MEQILEPGPLFRNHVIAVSACLLGVNCRYDGGNKVLATITGLCKDYTLIPVCPEQLGGLTTPRPPAEIAGGQIITSEGKVVTEAFNRGAQETLALLQRLGVQRAILKNGSPSCGVNRIYDGSFNQQSIPGEGVTAKLLREHGIVVLSEEDLQTTALIK